MKGADVQQSRTEHSMYSAQQELLQRHIVAQVLGMPSLVAAACQLGFIRDIIHTAAQVLHPQPTAKRRSSR